MIVQDERIEPIRQPIKVPRIIKIFGYFYMFTSICAFPVVALWMIYELKGFEILIGIFIIAFIFFLLIVGNGMVQGDVRALRAFLVLNKINIFYIFVNRRIEEYLDEVEK